MADFYSSLNLAKDTDSMPGLWAPHTARCFLFWFYGRGSECSVCPCCLRGVSGAGMDEQSLPLAFDHTLPQTVLIPFQRCSILEGYDAVRLL